jgi:4-amino-4-deoxy-L-arabinose transferase-like glycosyltransferase
VGLPGSDRQRHIILACILLTGLVRGLLYTLALPPWQHPDEPTHFEHVRYIAEVGRWPAWDDVNLPIRQAIAESMLRHNFWKDIPAPQLDEAALSAPGISVIGISTAAHPRLYYVLAAMWLKPWLGFPVETQLYALRWLSVMLNVAALALVYATAREIFPKQFLLAMSVCAFLLYQPMYSDVMTAVNNDALINTLGCAFFWVVARIFRRGWSLRRAALAAGVLLGALLTKTTAVALLAAFALSLLVYPWPGRAPKRALMWLAVIGLAVVGAALAFFLLGDAFPITAWVIGFVEKYFRVNWDRTLMTALNLQTLGRYYSAGVIVFRSFWAAFGWRHIVLNPAWYWAPGLATLLAVLGLTRTWLLERGRYPAWQVRYAGLALGAVLVAWAVAILRSTADQGNVRVYLSHGRYALVAIAPFALLFTAGILKWTPPAWRPWGAGAYVLGLAAFDLLCFWGALAPYYYG